MATHNPSDRIIKIYGKKDSSESYKLREFLGRHVVKYEWIELNSDEDCQHFLDINECIDNIRLPVVELPDGKRLFEPSEKDIGSLIGLVNKPKLKEYDLAIYGAGPAGLSAAVHASFDGLSTVLIERKAIGGQAGSSPLIENYLGFPNGISGAELAERARQQAVKFGVEILLLREGVAAEFSDNHIFVILEDGSQLVAKANLCACGIEYRRLGIANEEKFLNAGVFYGAGATEAPFCKDETIVIVGGGNGAAQGALNFARMASKVIMVVRGQNLSDHLSQYLIECIQANSKIEIIYNSVISGLEGNEKLEQVHVRNTKDNSEKTITTNHLFVSIGGIPQTEYFKNTHIIRDPMGYIVTGPDLLHKGKIPDSWPLSRHPYFLESSMPGFFAAGDVRHGSNKRYASAVGEGAMAVALIQRYLNENHS